MILFQQMNITIFLFFEVTALIFNWDIDLLPFLSVELIALSSDLISAISFRSFENIRSSISFPSISFSFILWSAFFFCYFLLLATQICFCFFTIDSLPAGASRFLLLPIRNFDSSNFSRSESVCNLTIFYFFSFLFLQFSLSNRHISNDFLSIFYWKPFSITTFSLD